MAQAKFSLQEEQLELLERCRQLGFRDRSAMVRAALNGLRERLEQRDLEVSAELYAQEYRADEGLRGLTSSATDGWPSDAD